MAWNLVSGRRRAALVGATLVVAASVGVTVAANGHDESAGVASGESGPVLGVTGAGAGEGDAAPSAPASGSASPSPAGTPSGSPSASAGARPSGSAVPSASAPAASASAGGAAPSPTGGQKSAPAQPAVPRPAVGAVFTGLAFDTCTAPAQATMDAWRRESPFGAAAVYIGGRNRGCAQPQLTGSWVKAVDAAGWKLIPLYVGAQAPCQSGRSPYRVDAANPGPQGEADGADAVARAASLGMRAGSALYLDVEAFGTGDAACAEAVLGYVRGWDRAVQQKGYVAGAYAYASSSAAVIARAAEQGVPDLPAALWYAQYDGQADTTASFPFGNRWSGRRGHQYLVNQKETHGGATVTVDRNAWDGPVAVIG